MMRKLLPAITAIGCSAIGLAALAAAWRRWGPSTYLRFDTMFGKARVYQVEGDDGRPVRLLDVGKVVQSGTYLDGDYAELVFAYLKRYDLMFDSSFGPGHDVRRICVLGCGGYDYPEHLIAHHPSTVVDAVEIDPAITAIARQFFFLDRLIAEYDAVDSGRLNLVCDDALHHLLVTHERYDAIVNDAFDAGTPPEHLATPEFARAVHDRLAPSGLYLVNVVATLDGPGSAFLHEQLTCLRNEFAHVAVFDCGPEDDACNPSLADNFIVGASDRPFPAPLGALSL